MKPCLGIVIFLKRIVTETYRYTNSWIYSLSELIILTMVTLLFIEISVLILVVRRLEFYNPIVFFLVLPFFYSHAFLLDYLVFGIDQLGPTDYFSGLPVDSINHLIIVALGFSYFFGVCLAFFSRSSYPTRHRLSQLALRDAQIFDRAKITSFSLMCLFASILVVLGAVVQFYGLSRDEVKALSTPIRTLISQYSYCFIAFFFIYFKSYRLLSLTLFALMLVFCVFSAERENIIILVLSLALRMPPVKFDFKKGILLSIPLILVTYYKPVIIALSFFLTTGLSNEALRDVFDKSVSFSAMDPATSIHLVNEYLLGGQSYENYWGSYLINTLMQFLRTFSDVNWPSLAETSTEYFTSGIMGTAFSFQLEALLNFWYFGPLILGYFLARLFLFIDSNSDKRFFKLHYLIWFILILKLVRTELAVVLKLYLLPALAAYVVFKLALQIREEKRKHQKNSHVS